MKTNYFASNLIVLRKERGISQAILADRLGTTQRRISYLENGIIEPDLNTLIAISDFFEFSLDELVLEKYR